MVLNSTPPVRAENEPKPKALPQQQQRTRTILGQGAKIFVESYILKGLLIDNQTFPNFCAARLRLNGATGRAEMAEGFDNHRRIFDGGDDLQGTAAVGAVFDVEDPFE